jgi:molecular chaperone GrpE (heat shock protein)
MQALSDEQRIDSLEKKIDDGFAEMRAEFKDLRHEMQAEFKALQSETQAEFKAVRGETQAEFKTVREDVGDELKAARAEQSAQTRMLIQIIGASCAALSSGFLALIVSQL